MAFTGKLTHAGSPTEAASNGANTNVTTHCAFRNGPASASKPCSALAQRLKLHRPEPGATTGAGMTGRPASDQINAPTAPKDNQNPNDAVAKGSSQSEPTKATAQASAIPAWRRNRTTMSPKANIHTVRKAGKLPPANKAYANAARTASNADHAPSPAVGANCPRPFTQRTATSNSHANKVTCSPEMATRCEMPVSENTRHCASGTSSCKPSASASNKPVPVWANEGCADAGDEGCSTDDDTDEGDACTAATKRLASKARTSSMGCRQRSKPLRQPAPASRRASRTVPVPSTPACSKASA